MQRESDHRLELLENKVRLLTRVALSLVLLISFALAASMWQPQDKSPASQRLKQVGRYQIAGAASSDYVRFVVVDTRTGVTKPVGTGTGGTNHWKAFDDIQMKKR